MINPLGAFLAAIGAAAGLRRREWAFFRPVPVAYLLVLAVFVVAGGKNYYLLGLLPPLAAAGSVVLAERRSPAAVRAFTAAGRRDRALPAARAAARAAGADLRATRSTPS